MLGEGPTHNNSMHIQARRCGPCDLNWPFSALDGMGEPLYEWCGCCGEPTRVITQLPKHILTLSEASNKRFEAWLKDEPEHIREAREKAQEERENERHARVQRFSEVILGAGFTAEERDEIALIERQLAGAGGTMHFAPDEDSD